MQKKTYCNYCGGKLTQKFFEGCIRPFCVSCNTPVYENPVPATAMVVINHEEKVLLVKRSVEPKKGLWCLPGGFIELGEAPEEGGLRELKEETGLSGKIDLLLGVTSTHSPRYTTVLMVGYLVKTFSGELVAGDDASDAAYFHKDAMPELAFKSHRDFIGRYYSAYASLTD